ncbi:hypothetical protein BD410DRAFT_838966 [Rickenella mellea]|uniref:Uncharacterized protein n=1 Tax=Rickenella mellea TaxID=50990 RepID=A0A4Y7Q836_9AGAM|nr:hypothetical protein BD410DRAFT_838966 [Rickenella mellea]
MTIGFWPTDMPLVMHNEPPSPFQVPSPSFPSPAQTSPSASTTPIDSPPQARLYRPDTNVVGVVGYVETPRRLRTLTTVWASHLSDELKRRFYKDWHRSKKKAFMRYAKKHTKDEVLAHTQIRQTGLKQKKAHLGEIQDEVIDVMISVARAGQRQSLSLLPMMCVYGDLTGLSPDGYHHRTELDKKIYHIGKDDDDAKATTEANATKKAITPMRGFPHYGIIKNDFLMLKGCPWHEKGALSPCANRSWFTRLVAT